MPLDSLTNKLQLVPLIEVDSCGNRKLGKKYPPGNDHISHQGNRKIIDSKVPTGRGYVSSLEGTDLPIDSFFSSFIFTKQIPDSYQNKKALKQFSCKLNLWSNFYRPEKIIIP